MDPRGLARELMDEVQSQVDAGAVDIEFLRPPTRAALRERLKDTKRPVHVLHFDGHGIFEGPIDPKNSLNKIGGEQGKLAFEDADGKLDLVKAEDLAQILLDSGVRLAVLDACQSAMGSSENAFSSVATRLIQSGVDAVVAMSASVLVASSTRFFETFYRELAAGTPAPTAQERARQALYDDPRRHSDEPQARRRRPAGRIARLVAASLLPAAPPGTAPDQAIRQARSTTGCTGTTEQRYARRTALRIYRALLRTAAN